MKNRTLAIALCLLVSTAATAQGLVYVKAGHMVDVVDGKMRADQTIVIRGDRIERVASTSSIDIPAGARVIDLGNATVLPGLIDMHVHLTGDPDAQGYANLAASVPRNALYGAANGRRTMNAGFTTVRNVGAGGYADVALRDAINNGDVVGPRMRVAAHSLGITGGHCDNNFLPAEYAVSSGGVADGPWEIRKKVRENVKYGADLTKFCATGGVLSKGTTVGAQQYTLEEMIAIVSESHQRDRKVAAHAHGTEGIIAAIRAGVDSVEHASLIDDEGIRLAKANGTFLVMDVYVDTYILEMGEAAGFLPESLEKERQVGQAQRNNFRKAHAAGVRMAFGTDAGVYPHGNNGKQFAYMVQYGMTPMEAIQAATVNAAELLGWPGDVGAIESGSYADLIAVRGNPLEDIRELEDVRFVMKGGEVFKQW
ncbi:MAG: amidohydrolase family protein [Gammaproteobacteria bacterium]|nr:amidohydrolase family protein [Gammaproteobacteria bacterium]